uniref:Core shell protein Gag P30 domain-containing protein n=1 Tax=Rousettus aegyptiacus TaxID=9407 RepID=A0A7J8DI09_ROUAE|nr:hypothetical protein HJG63_008619 [Rousettus aegyptiacus]
MPERPPGPTAVPDTDPGWNYQEGQLGRDQVQYMVECLLEGMETAAHKIVNLLKLDSITQGPDENLAMFLNRLTEALVLHMRLTPEFPVRAATLANPFISQWAPDIERNFPRPRTVQTPPPRSG